MGELEESTSEGLRITTNTRIVSVVLETLPNLARILSLLLEEVVCIVFKRDTLRSQPRTLSVVLIILPNLGRSC